MDTLSFTCPRCEREIPVTTAGDLPDVQVKIRRVERACSACGNRVTGLEAPPECPSDSCPDPDRGYSEPERIVTNRIAVPICTDCQDDLDTEAEVTAALTGD